MRSVNTSRRCGRSRTDTLNPWFVQGDIGCGCIAHYQMAWPRADHLAMSLKDFIVAHVLLSLHDCSGRPESGHTGEDRPWVLSQRVKRRQPVRGDRDSERYAGV